MAGQVPSFIPTSYVAFRGSAEAIQCLVGHSASLTDITINPPTMLLQAQGTNAPHSLSDLFAKKIESAFNLGHETLKNVIENSLSVTAVFAASKAINTVLPLASWAVKKLPERVTNLAAYVPGIPAGNLLKFLGLLILVTPALEPLVKKILLPPVDEKKVEVSSKIESPKVTTERETRSTTVVRKKSEDSGSDDENSTIRRQQHQQNDDIIYDDEFKPAVSSNVTKKLSTANILQMKAICGLVTFIVARKIGWNISIVSGVASAALLYPLAESIGKTAGERLSQFYETFQNDGLRAAVSSSFRSRNVRSYRDND